MTYIKEVLSDTPRGRRALDGVSQLTLTTLPQPVIDAIKTRIDHLQTDWTISEYTRRAYACRELWPKLQHLTKTQLKDKARFLRTWLEKKNDPSRRQWVELAMLDYLKETK